jgi:hypothetical protein
MYIISFDVGIRNLAFIIIDVSEEDKSHQIVEWNVLELCPKNVKACHVDNIVIGMSMMKQLDDIISNYRFDKIIIENQIGQNAIKMKSVQGMLNMYFIMRNYDDNHIVNYNAVHKLKSFLGSKKTTYSERKKLSKQVTRQIIMIHFNEQLEHYDQYKKKDDLADCYLQVLDYINKKGYVNEEFYTSVNID